MALVGLLACGSYHVLVHAPRAATGKDAERLAAARSFASKGEWGPAERVLAGLIEGEDAASDPALRAAARVARARCRLEQGDLRGSLRDADAALSGEAPSLEALRLRTHLLLLQGEHQAALSDAEEAVERGGSWEDYALRGEALVLSREAQRGLVDFDRALLQAPSAARARLQCGRGRALDALGKSERALEAFEEALGLQPSLVDALIGRGVARLHLRRADAEADFQRADSLMGPDDPRRAALEAARSPGPAPRE